MIGLGMKYYYENGNIRNENGQQALSDIYIFGAKERRERERYL